jgi:hypothetical protein
MDIEEARLRELQRDVAVDAQRFASFTASALSVTVTDPYRCVRLTVEGNGAISGLSISEGWKANYSEPQLADLVVALAGEAASRQLAAWVPDGPAASASDQVTDDGSSTESPTAQFLELADQLGPADNPETVLSALSDFLDEAIAAVDGSLDGALTIATKHYNSGHPNDQAYAEVDSTGRLIGLRFRPGWAARSSSAQLAHTARRAIDAARDAAAREVSSDPLADTPLGVAVATASDPVALAKRVGLME